MIQFNFFLIVLTMFTASAWAHDLDGLWVGNGTRQTGYTSQPTVIKSELQLKLTENELTMTECWEFLDQDNRPTKSCMESQYQIQDEAIFHDTEKVGDVFPEHIVIYERTRQASEQIVIQMLSEKKIFYRYGFLTYDGVNDLRAAELTLQP